MWIYEKKLQYPVKITKPCPKIAKVLMAQYGGPDSELSAGVRYLNQRYSIPCDQCRAMLTDIGTEEFAHWEMIATMIHQLMRGATVCQLQEAGLSGHYTMHSCALFPADPNGVPFTTAYLQATGDPVADLHEDMAAEQKARATYEHLICQTDDPDVIDPLRFLREREVVHFQRFGECLNKIQQMLCEKDGVTRCKSIAQEMNQKKKYDTPSYVRCQ